MIEEIFNWLPGTWQLQRFITMPQNHYDMQGSAHFIKQTTILSSLYYREEGILNCLSKKPIKAYRDYFYRHNKNNISVLFVENAKPGKLLHTLDFTYPHKGKSVKASAKHVCGKDKYKALYVFYDKDEFSLTYQVKGPYKDYTSTSIFKRPLCFPDLILYTGHH